MTNSFLPSRDSIVLPDPFSHGYLYGSSSHVFGDGFPYTPEEQAAAHAGTLLPIDYTDVNHTFAFGTGGCHLHRQRPRHLLQGVRRRRPARSRAPGSADQQPAAGTCGQARGVLRVRLERAPVGRQLDRVPWGETAGFNLFAGYDRTNQLAIVVWTNLTLGIDDARANANQTILKVLDQIYTPSPLAPLPPRGTG
jgi:D-alanyl-D-alanine carboxypeptidase